MIRLVIWPILIVLLTGGAGASGAPPKQPSIEDLKLRSEHGSALAMTELALLYLRSDDAKAKAPEAQKLIRQALALTQSGTTAEPTTWLTICTGICEPWRNAGKEWERPGDELYGRFGPDPETLKARAEQGDVMAMRTLGSGYGAGLFFYWGWGRAPDPTLSDYWFKRASAAGWHPPLPQAFKELRLRSAEVITPP